MAGYTNNVSLGALIRITNGIAFQDTELSPTTASTPFYYYTTSLFQNSISLGTPGDDGSDDYIISQHDLITSTATATTILSKSDESRVVGVGRNSHSSQSLPDELTIVEGWSRIFTYLAVFVLGAICNIFELVWVCLRIRARGNSKPVNTLFLHLCIADIIVVFMVAGVEVFWRISIGWYAGNFMCKAVMFFRAFGLYLSSLMIICISLDRFYAVLYPLRVIDASRRVRWMLIFAWGTAFVSAIPQGIVFREETHPHFPSFHQCSTLWFPELERINAWISITMVYFIPLGVIIFSYGSIIVKIAQILRENRGDGASGLRRNGIPVFQRAKLRTLKLTFIIIFTFLMCWGPYIVLTTWYLIDEQSATNLDGDVQDCLFLFAVANSVANPLVYGLNESCKKKKEQPQETCKEPELRSDAMIMKNYNNSSCKCNHSHTHATRVRFSNHSPQLQPSVAV